MNCAEKICKKKDVFAKLSATWGGIKNGKVPVELKVNVRLEYKKGTGYALSFTGELSVRKNKRLGLRQVEIYGQCLDTASRYLHEFGLECKALDEMIPIWKKWHLNDLMAGTVRQTEFLDGYRESHPEWVYDYGEACEILKRHGLYRDGQHLVNGKPYEYGSEWLFHEIPQETIDDLCRIIDGGMSIERKGV